MDVYSIAALFARLILAFFLYQTAKAALSGSTRKFGNTLDLITAVSLFFGLYVYLFTLILIMKLGFTLWNNRKRGLRLNRDLAIFLLTFVLFLKGPGEASLDKILGNI